MNTVYFSDKTTREISDQEMLNLVKRLTHMGLKVHRTRYLKDAEEIWILSPSNISRVVMGRDDDEDENDDDSSTSVESVVIPEVSEGTEDREGDTTPVEEEEPETQQQRNDRLLAEMKEKSDCAGNGHEGKEQVIHFQDVMIRKKGAKTSLPSRRYFPVCSFCGLRQKYVKADSLTDEQKENAKLYEV